MLRLFIAALNLYATLFLPFPAGADNGPSLSKPLKSAWSYSAGEMLDLPAVALGQNLYVPLAGGKVVSVAAAGGNLNWKTEVGGEISATPAADEGGVYVATAVSTDARTRGAKARGVLRLLSPESGVPVWVRPLEAPASGSLVASGGVLYAATSQGRLYAVEGKTGEIKWVRQHDAEFQPHTLLAGNTLVIGDEAGRLFAIESSTGSPLWSYRTQTPFRQRPVIQDGAVFVGSADNVYALDLESGRMLWRARTSGRVGGLAFGAGGVVVTTLDNFVYKYSAAEGRRIWKRRLPGRVTASPLVTPDGVLLSPLSGDEVIILSPETGKKINSVEVAEDSNTSAPALLSGEFLVLSTRRGVYAFTN